MNPRQAITVATACAHAHLEIQGKMPLVNNPVKSQTNNFVRRKFILKPAPIINISNFEN